MPCRAFVDSDELNLFYKTADGFVLMPCRAFVDSDGAYFRIMRAMTEMS